MPFILSVQQKGKLLDATGIHPASMGSLFVENYFKDCIESEIEKVDESSLNSYGLNDWGSYYETCPQVIALDAKLSFENISKQDTSIALVNRYQDSIKNFSKLITNNNL